MSAEDVLKKLSASLQRGEIEETTAAVRRAMEEGIEPRTILDRGLLEAMNEVGEKFKNNEIFVPEVMMAARAMKEGLKLLQPALIETGVEARGTAVLGTVKGDMHDIGKNLVIMMLEGAGFEVHDLGTDVPAEEFIRVVQEEDARILGMSALLTTTMPYMKEVISRLEAAGLRDRTYVMVGGAPVTENFARDIGADAYAGDAGTAASLARETIEK
ncbi:MAG: cobalamin B12-binding domain-containing protein [Halanaerobiaceae bacterium]